MNFPIRLLVVAAAASVIAACATTQAPAPSGTGGGAAPRSGPNVNLSGYPPAFKDGFRDGCDSLRGSYRRDPARFGKDNDYTLGWQDGYSICGRPQYR
jgi:hypothetical protein